jgi:hypothetical protein
LAAAIAMVLSLSLAPGALAATDTVTNAHDSGRGSLRDVISHAASGDTIRFDSRVTGTIMLTSGTIHIDKNLTINGPAPGQPTVDANGNDRIFTIIGGSVSIYGLTFTKGHDLEAGGAIYDSSPGSLTVRASTFRDNDTGKSDLEMHYGGGAIFYVGSGQLSVQDSTFMRNTARAPDTGSEQGRWGFGGAINFDSRTGSASISHSTFTENAAGGFVNCPDGDGYGGAIYYYGYGRVAISDDTFTFNTAGGRGCGSGGGVNDPRSAGDTGWGGAIWDGGPPGISQEGTGGVNNPDGSPKSTGSLSISGSTFADNHAGGQGSLGGTGQGHAGAVGAFTLGSVTVTGSSFYDNTAGGPAGGFGSANSGEGDGGAIEEGWPWQGGGGSLSVSNSTLANNSAGGSSASGEGGAMSLAVPTTLVSDTIDGNSVGSEDIFGAPHDGSAITGAGQVRAAATIVAGNTGASSCDTHVASSRFDLEGPTGSRSCGFDLPSADPQLQPVGDNGGPTATQELRASSPAVDRAPAASCAGSADERGMRRPDGREAVCDLGAYEHQDAPARPLMWTSPTASAVHIGQSFHDTARLSGGDSPTGTVTFRLFANKRCSGEPVFTSTNALASMAASSGTYTPRRLGIYEWTAHYSGDEANAPVASRCHREQVTVGQNPAPSISTAPAPTSATVGRSIHDTALVTDGRSGIVTFALYASRHCTGRALFLSSRPVRSIRTLGSRRVASASYTTTSAGTYQWRATYKANDGSGLASSRCGSEPVLVAPPKPMPPSGPAQPTISTKPAPSSALVGQPLKDTALVTGGRNPTGTVKFELFASANCTGSPVFASSDPLDAAHSARSDPYTTTQAGMYEWVAVYTGDAANAPDTSACGSEPVTVSPAQPTISTKPVKSSVAVGQSLQDTAKVSGGTSPTGTVHFELFATKDCSGKPVFTSANPLTSTGDATSDSYTTTQAGSYQWVAVYSGDAGNGGAKSPCGSEPVTVTPQ